MYPPTVSQAVTTDSDYYIPTYNKSMLHGEISKCSKCGFVFTSDRLTVDGYHTVYAEMEDPQYLKEARAYKASFNHILDKLEPYKKNGKALLEIGCGAGFFLQQARNRDWDVHGIELSKWMSIQAEKSLGDGVVGQGGFETEHKKRKRFNVIVAIHVIEHIADPRSFLRIMHERLEDDGVLYLVTPDIGSLLAKILREKWWYIQIPHIYYFNPKSISNILNQHAFAVEKISRYPRFVSRDIFKNRINFFPKLLRPFLKVLLAPFLLRDFTLRIDTGDQMTIISRKNLSKSG